MGCAPSSPAVAHTPTPPAVNGASLPLPRRSTPLPPLPEADAASAPPAVRDAAAALVASGGPSSARVAARLLHVAATRGGADPLATRLRLSHPRIHAALVLPAGGLELFEALGWRCVFEVYPAGAAKRAEAAAEAWLVLDAPDPPALAAGVAVLRQLGALAHDTATATAEVSVDEEAGGAGAGAGPGGGGTV